MTRRRHPARLALCLACCAGAGVLAPSLASGQEATKPRLGRPAEGDAAPIASLVLADLEGQAWPLAQAWRGQAEWVVVHVFDPRRMDLLPGTDEYGPGAVGRAGRDGGSLDPARAPSVWGLNDYLEQAHARFAGQQDLRWIGIPAWDLREEDLTRALAARSAGAKRPACEPISPKHRTLLDLHLKRRTRYDVLLQAPTPAALARLGVKRAPAILVFDKRGTLVFSWQEVKAEAGATNFLLREIYALREERAKRQRLSESPR